MQMYVCTSSSLVSPGIRGEEVDTGRFHSQQEMKLKISHIPARHNAQTRKKKERKKLRRKRQLIENRLEEMGASLNPLILK
jgi:hypothetical protein